MTTRNRLTIGILVMGLSLSLAMPAWAIPSPEPSSGGRFFRAKGTKASSDFTEYGRVGQTDAVARTEDYHYRRGLQAGPLNIKPNGSYTGEYDSNVFLQDDNGEGDWINRLKWGVDSILPINEGQHSLYGGVQSETEWFSEFDSQDHTDWNFQGGGEMNFNSFSLEIFEEFSRTVDRSDNELTQRLDRKENYLLGLLTVPFGEYFLETEVSDFDLQFRDPAFEPNNRNELRLFPRVGVNVGDSTQALVEYGHTYLNYELEDRTGHSNQASVGLRGLLGELTSYQVWGGWEFRNYDTDSRNDFQGPIARGELVYRPSDFTRLTLDADRRVVESVSAGQSYYVQNQASVRYRRQLSEKLIANARGTVRLNSYDTQRDDFYLEPAVGLEYILPYTDNIAAVFSEYRWTLRASDSSGTDYSRQLVNMGVKAEF